VLKLEIRKSLGVGLHRLNRHHNLDLPGTDQLAMDEKVFGVLRQLNGAG